MLHSRYILIQDQVCSVSTTVVRRSALHSRRACSAPTARRPSVAAELPRYRQKDKCNCAHRCRASLARELEETEYLGTVPAIILPAISEVTDPDEHCSRGEPSSDIGSRNTHNVGQTPAETRGKLCG